ncbi:MAG: Ca-activated chloride channel family protein [Bacteroidia bacterium]|jgi:Ca-activated chloride channel family protein
MNTDPTKQEPKGLYNLPQHNPNPNLWDKIESDLDRKRPLFWPRIWAIAATIALIATASFLFNNKLQNDTAELVPAKKETDSLVLDVEFHGEENTLDGDEIEIDHTVVELPTINNKANKSFIEPIAVAKNSDQTSLPNQQIIVSSDSLLQTPKAFAITTDVPFLTIEPNSYSWATDATTHLLTPAYTFSATAPTFDYSTVYAEPGEFVVSIDAEESTSGIETTPEEIYSKDANFEYENQTKLDYSGNEEDILRNIEFKNAQVPQKGEIKHGSVTLDKKASLLGSTTIKRSRYKKTDASGFIGDRDNDGVANYYDNNARYLGSDIEVPTDRDMFAQKYQATISDSVSWNFGDNNVEPNTENYAPLVENTYKRPTVDPLSTFGIDVDNASYTVMRTKINAGIYVPKDAVRVEEYVNYFSYDYPQPNEGEAFSVNLEAAACPWNANHQLVRIGLKGRDIDINKQDASNLVFLIDVSGSMEAENKLPLVKKSLKLLVDQMGPNDRIAIVTYAGAAGLVLPSTKCDEKEFIKKKIDRLDAGGSTAGGEGIKLAYQVALDHHVANGNNRVILCTDGDFNVGQHSDSEMKQLIINNRDKNIFITACGFGMGNYQDSKMETIADHGNGNYFYIDNFKESLKVFERDLRSTLFTIAKDVKIQVEFNPKHVKAYRLIGYENRLMPPQDFNDDTKDGGELGAGHTVTALYEIIPAGSEEAIPGEIELKYQTPENNFVDFGNEMLTVKLRYKKPRENTSQLIEVSMEASNTTFEDASQDFQFASGVALFAQQLRQSEFVPKSNFEAAKQIATNARGLDPNGDRGEFTLLISKAQNIYEQAVKKE